MEIFKMEVGEIGTNCYLVYDEETKVGIIIDPGDNGKELLAEVEKRQLKIKYVVNTHGHWDHIGANDEVCAATGAKLLIHEDDAACLGEPSLNMSGMLSRKSSTRAADILLKEGDTVEFGDLSLEVIHTPGHTRGGICLYGAAQHVLFSGDTLFQFSIGRTDFPGGSYTDLIKNIKEKLLILPDDTIVCPGHGPVTKIETEKKRKSFLI